MTADNVRAGGRSAGYGPFVTGLVLIVSATLLNLYLTGKSRADLDLLPSFLVTAYEKSGKLGVTMVLGSLGVLVMLWGWFLQAASEARHGARRVGGPTLQTLQPEGGSGSSMTLMTAKYVAEAQVGRQFWVRDEHRAQAG